MSSDLSHFLPIILEELFEVHHSIVTKIIHKWKTFNTIATIPTSEQIHPEARPCNAQRNLKKK